MKTRIIKIAALISATETATNLHYTFCDRYFGRSFFRRMCRTYSKCSNMSDILYRQYSPLINDIVVGVLESLPDTYRFRNDLLKKISK